MEIVDMFSEACSDAFEVALEAFGGLWSASLDLSKVMLVAFGAFLDAVLGWGPEARVSDLVTLFSIVGANLSMMG